MKWLDLTLDEAAENLACDEALLDWCEEAGGEVLRFWEPLSYFVVVGYANRVAAEVNQAACLAAGVPVYRRCSGGGTVLQGPGCLNYSLVLQVDEAGPLGAVGSTNRFIMERLRAGVQDLLTDSGSEHKTASQPRSWKATFAPAPCMELLNLGGTSHASPRLLKSGPRIARPSQVCGSLGEPAVPVESDGDVAVALGPTAVRVEGHTDLTIGGRKFSGNAQRRKRRALLFHGTFLWAFDLSRIGQFLKLPSKQPPYRQGRSHDEFLVNLPVSPAQIRQGLRQAWRAEEPVRDWPVEAVSRLAAAKYDTPAWNLKF